MRNRNMKALVAVVIVSILANATADAQKRKRTPARSRAASAQPSDTSKAKLIGSTVVIITKNGDRITGELLDLTAYSVRIKADSLESSLALDTIASLSFSGSTPPSGRADQPPGPVRADFARDAGQPLGVFQTLAASLKPGVDYTEYGRQLTELRRAVERFVGKYSSTDNPSEARVLSLMSGALTDYTWARSIWSLKFARSSDGTVSETESPVVIDTLALYTDARAAAAAGNRLSVEKLIGVLWRKASEKTDRAGTLVTQPH